MSFDNNKMLVGRARMVYVVLFLVFATAEISAASCVTELSKIVKTPQGRLRSPRGEAVADAYVVVSSSSGDVIFQTKSEKDGSFQLLVSPGRYGVEVKAEGYLRLLYIVDLRSVVAGEPLDVPLQSLGECHDVRISSEEDTKEPDCSTEVLRPNLILRTPAVIGGEVKDETGAPFRNSEIVLRKVSAIPLQPGYLVGKTDADGAFSFDESEPGEYRLLASPNRGFAQPAKLDCYERRECNLEIVLKANSTDLPYAGCPVR